MDTKPELGYIICPAWVSEVSDDTEVLAVVADYGWDISQADIVKIDPSMINQHFNANPALKRARFASAWNGPPEWVPCFVIDRDDLFH